MSRTVVKPRLFLARARSSRCSLSQTLGDPRDQGVARGDRARELQPGVNHPRQAFMNDRNASPCEQAGVELALVAQRVVVVGDDEGGTDVREIARADRRQVRVAAVGFRGVEREAAI